jgi:hypothetical protein
MSRDVARNRNQNVLFGYTRALSDAFSKEPTAKETATTAGYEQLPEVHEEQILCYQIRPLLFMLRAIGCFPVQISKSGQ